MSTTFRKSSPHCQRGVIAAIAIDTICRVSAGQRVITFCPVNPIFATCRGYGVCYD